MSDVQNAIEELVQEQVESRIDDAISDSNEINEIKHNVETLEARLGDDIVNQVVKEVITKLMSTLDGNYVMVKKSYLDSLTEKNVA